MDWKAIEGDYMQLTGRDTVNGKGSYGFMIDAAKNRPKAGGKDKFCIRIWDQGTGSVVYNNMPGIDDYVIPVTHVQGGEIKLTP